jgi:uncharacterized membrane protein HdeD (DUF308 family)
MSALLARNWWAIALRGALALMFGIAALAVPGITTRALVIAFGAYTLADGVLAIVSAIRTAGEHERWWPLVIEGLVNMGTGMIAFWAPEATLLAFVYLSAAWAILSGAAMLAALGSLHRSHGKWVLGLTGLVSVLWGILLAYAPATGALVMTTWLGAYALLFGAVLLVLAFQLRSQRLLAASQIPPQGFGRIDGSMGGQRFFYRYRRISWR